MILVRKEACSNKAFTTIEDILDQASISYKKMNRLGRDLLYVEENIPEGLLTSIRETGLTLDDADFSTPYKLAGREFKSRNSIYEVNGEQIGGDNLNLIAGPCAVESEEQIYTTAKFLADSGVRIMRGGAYKPRTSPYSFQGLELEGLKMMRRAADEFGLSIITEVLDFDVLDEVYEYADILQVGSRNMHNYYFLKKLGEVNKPVLLKRGMFARITEWLLAAEYILIGGNEQVILCERGIRSFDNAVRNVMDISAIPMIKELSHLPVWADPSQGTGRRSLVEPMSMAAVAAGADGLMIETHPDPVEALSDGEQSMFLDDLPTLIEKLKPLSESVGKKLYIDPVKYRTNQNI